MLVALTWVNCTRQQSFVNQDLISKYYNALTPALTNSYDYLTNAITNNEPLSKKTFNSIVQTNLQGKTLPATPLPATPSESFKATCKNLINAMEANKLKTHEDFLVFGEEQLNAIKDDAERENAAMIIGAANAISDYCTLNADKLQALMLNPNVLNYIEAKTGMLIFQTGGVIKTIVVAVVAVAGFIAGLFEEPKNCDTWDVLCRVDNAFERSYEYGLKARTYVDRMERLLNFAEEQ